ncbi:MAG: NlpC/P60 family protein [Coriobacteriia bacterium]|nr:NlpC/P60 family protein [Coriobacteriia bacterium]
MQIFTNIKALKRTCALPLAIALLVSAFTAPAAVAAPAASGTPAAAKPSATNSSEIDIAADKDTEEFRDELAQRQARLQEFEAQLLALDRELELATEEYNAAAEELAKIKEDIQANKSELADVQAAYNAQTGLLGNRASSIYRTGPLNTVEVLLDSSSMSDLFARVKFLNTLSTRDAEIAASLKAQKELLDRRMIELQSAEAAAESLEFELKTRRIDVMLRVEERQEAFADARNELLELLDAEAARHQAEQDQLLAEILSGVSSKGIVVKPGTPVETALAYHGVPYLWGGETPSGFDCSGLVLYVFAQHGVKLPHYSGSQFQLGDKVTREALVPGDVVFFGSPIHHVGIYIGSGYYIHAPRTGDFVKISRLADRNDYAGARRYPWRYRVAPPKEAVVSTDEVLSKYNQPR